MGRFRQGHWGQASWVPSQEPVSSQLTMATRAAMAEQPYALRPAGRRMETGKGAQAGGDLLGLGDPCSSTGSSAAGFLSSKTAATFYTEGAQQLRGHSPQQHTPRTRQEGHSMYLIRTVFPNDATHLAALTGADPIVVA